MMMEKWGRGGRGEIAKEMVKVPLQAKPASGKNKF